MRYIAWLLMDRDALHKGLSSEDVHLILNYLLEIEDNVDDITDDLQIEFNRGYNEGYKTGYNHGQFDGDDY